MLSLYNIRVATIILSSTFIFPGCSHKRVEDRMSVENKKSADSIYRVGYSMFKAGDYTTATRMFKQALSVDSGHLPSLVGLAQVARQTHQVTDTAILLEKALVKTPDNLSLIVELAKLYVIDNEGLKAEQLLRKVMVKDASLDVFNALGVALDLQEKHEEAQAYYQKALKLDAYHVGVLSNMGLSLALQGRYHKSLSFLEPLLKRDHPTPRDRQNVALVYALLGNPEHARRIYKLDLDDKAIEGNLSAISKLSSKLLEKSYKIDVEPLQPVMPDATYNSSTPDATSDFSTNLKSSNFNPDVVGDVTVEAPVMLQQKPIRNLHPKATLYSQPDSEAGDRPTKIPGIMPGLLPNLPPAVM